MEKESRSKSAHGWRIKFVKNENESAKESPRMIVKPISRKLTPSNSRELLECSHLGPGAYYKEESFTGQSHEFSKASRFGLHYQDIERSKKYSALSLLRKSNCKEKIEFNLVVNNRDMSRFAPVERKIILSERAERQKERSKETKTLQKLIYNRKIKDREKIFKEKFRKFEFRRQKPLIVAVLKSWVLLPVLLSTSQFFHYSFMQFKYRKKRIAYLLLWFIGLIKSIIKLKKILIKIRTKRSLRTIRSKLPFYIKKWLRTEKQIYRTAIIKKLRTKLSQKLIKELQIKWREKCELIQKECRKFLEYRRYIYSCLIQDWDSIEIELLQTKKKRKLKLPKKKKKILPKILMPLNIKHYFIKLHILNRIKKGYPLYLKEDNQTKKELKDLIQIAYKQRENWVSILQAEIQQISLSYKEMEKIEGVIKGIFNGGGYIQQADGQLFIYYESNLKETESEILKRNSRVVALITGMTVIEIKQKEDNQPWTDATLMHLIL